MQFISRTAHRALLSSSRATPIRNVSSTRQQSLRLSSFQPQETQLSPVALYSTTASASASLGARNHQHNGGGGGGESSQHQQSTNNNNNNNSSEKRKAWLWLVGGSAVVYGLASWEAQSTGEIQLDQRRDDRQASLIRAKIYGDWDKIRTIIQAETNDSVVRDRIRFELLSAASNEKELQQLCTMFNFAVESETEWKKLLLMSLQLSWGLVGRSTLATWIIRNKIDAQSMDEAEFDDWVSRTITRYDTLAMEALFDMKPKWQAKTRHLNEALQYGHLVLDMIRVLIERGRVHPTREHLMVVLRAERSVGSEAEKRAHMALIRLLVKHGANGMEYDKVQFTSPYEYPIDSEVRKLLIQ